MLRRHFALLTVCFGSIISVAACGGSDDSSPSGTGGGGATDGGTGGSGGGTVDKQEPGAQPPADPGGTPGAGTDPTVIAVRKLFVGETDRQGNPDPNAWKSFGYNLDGLISTKSGTNHCAPAKGANPASVKTDGNDGIDNSFGGNLIPIIKTFTSNPSDDISASLEDGSFTIMVKMDNLDANADQTAIKAALYGGAKLDPPPNWDGNDEWPVFPELLNNGDINNPKVKFDTSYVAGGTWVSGSPGTLNLAVSIQGFDLNLNITQAQIGMDVSGTGTNATASNGIIAGVIETEVLINELKKIAGGFDPNLCDGATFDSIAQQIRAASDIMKDGTNGDSAKTCDAISIGLAFEGQAVKLGPVAPPATPSPDPCATN
ncbi:MAG: hypothetical protein KC776_40005 [Myxococcales bacterium]|nr:hypothetical protein [Myxococcales bacterium]MCB9580620.1 hypothetical protein [Polyangiaceae bacterium]